MKNRKFKAIATILIILGTLFASVPMFAQTPNTGIFFQAVARDNFANPAKDRKIFVETSVLQTTSTGTVVLKESHQTTTDATGVFSITIGQGTRIGGTAAGLYDIPWAQGPFFLNLKIAITPTAPVVNWDYTKDLVDLGTTSLGTVPYALYAGSVAGFDTKLNVLDTAKMLSSYARVANLNSLVTNKVNVADSTIVYVTPTQLKAKTFDSTSIYNALNLKENSANKSTNITTDATSDTKYPSVKAVKNYVDGQISVSTIVDADANTKGKLQLAGDLTGTAALPTIANNAITTNKIADANVTDAKIATVSGSKVTGNIAGNANNVTGTIAITNGGTGATSAAAARTNLGLTIGTDVLAQRTFGTAANNNTADFEPAITIGTAPQYWRGDKTWQTLNTTAVPEGSNLYYTTTRANADFDTRLATKSTTNLTEGTNLYYTDARVKSALTLTTTGNSGAATYSSTTGTFNIPNYTLTGLGYSLNGLADASQTFATGTNGTDFNISSALGVHTFNLPDASATARGLVTTGSQTFAGSKVFNNDLVVNGIRIGMGTGSGNYIQNTTVGRSALSNNTTGEGNTAFGYQGQANGTTGSANTSVGFAALTDNITGGGNTAIGYQALQKNKGSNNIAIGSNAMYLSQNSNNNIVLGNSSLDWSTNGANDNIVLGKENMRFATTASQNLVIGHGAGASFTTETNNTLLGTSTDILAGVNNATAIGSGAVVNASNTIQLGNTSVTSVVTSGTVSATGFTGPLTGNVTGNASTATALATGRTIATTGDVTYTSGNFDGSANVTGVATLANSGVVSGTYGSSTAIPSLTIDSKGRITNATTTSIIAGVNTVNAIASVSNASGATISGTTITLTPADGTNGGVVTTGAQTFAGVKTFSNTTTFNTDVKINGLTVGIGTGNINTNSAVGFEALKVNTSGYSNAAFGGSAMTSNTTGYYNTAIGKDAMHNNTSGLENTGIGLSSMYNNIGGNYNTALGSSSLVGNTSGDYNVAIGRQALGNSISGGYNVAVGAGSLNTNTTGTNNTAIGASADISANNLYNATAIGYGAIANASNRIQLGNTGVTSVVTSGTVSATGFTGPIGATTASTGNFTNVTSPIYISTPQTLTAGSTISWDPTIGLNASVTLSQNSTLSFGSTPPIGTSGTLIVTQPATGGPYNLTLPTVSGKGNKVLGSSSGLNLSTTNNAQDIVSFYYDGNNFYWNVGNGYGANNVVTASAFSGSLPVANGGTGATTAGAALTNLGAEATANKSTEIDMGGLLSSNTKYPSQLAVKTYVSNQFASGGVADGSITNAKLYGGVTAAKLVGTDISTVGTITTGTWNANTITVPYGGTGATSLTGYVKGNGTLSMTASTSIPVADITNGESILNRAIATDLGGSGAADSKYPSQLAVKTYVDTKVAAATIADADANTKGKIQLAGDLGSTASAPLVVSVGGSTASNIHSAEQLANAATDANTVSTIVKRNSSGDFTAHTVTANLVGDVTGNVSGTAANVTAIVTGAHGGTGINNGTKTMTFGGDFVTAGTGALTLTYSGTTNVSLPASGTVATLSGSENLNNKTINGLSLNNLSTGFSINGGTASKTFTLTDNASLSGTNTGDQTITLTGDVTGSGTGSFATTLANTAVTAGSYGTAIKVPALTVDSKGRITNVTETTITGVSPIGSNLASGNLVVGDGSGIAQSVPITGDFTINSSGVGTISSSSVTNDKLAGGIDLATKVIGALPVANGGTGATSLTGYIKGAGNSAFTSVSSIPVADVTGAVQKVNGVAPVGGNVTVPTVAVITGTYSDFTLTSGTYTGTAGTTYVVSQDIAANNGRTFIFDGTSTWHEITTNQAATDARYLIKSGDIMTGTLTVPSITISSAPSASSDATTKSYVDDQITNATPSATSSVTGKIQLRGDLGGTATAPTVVSVGGSTASAINAATVLANAAVYSNTANTIVRRDVSGNFSAGAITASLIGNVTGNVSGTANNVTGVVAVANGGSGASTLTGYIKGNGTSAYTAAAAIPVADVTNAESNQNKQSATDLGGANSNNTNYPTQLAVKTYVDASVAAATIADATSSVKGKIQLAGDLGNTAASPTVVTVGGSTASNINAATILANAATASNTASAIVKRDGSGNFSAGMITANLTGNVTGNASGTAANVTGIVSGANGGTGVVNTGKTITLGGNFVTSGTYSTTLITTNNTSVTLPTTGTLATLTGSESFTNKIINGLTPTALTTGFTIAGGSTTSKTLTVAGDANISGTNTGDQTITLSGDISGSGTAGITATLASTGVTAGTYGSSTAIPALTIDAKGRITSATTTSIIAGVNTVTSIAGTSNAAGATISGTTITLTPADGTNGGVLTNGAQTIAGAKTFNSLITGSISGNAGTATTLATGRTIGITGDLTYTSPSFDGSGNITAAATLANSGVVSGTYGSSTAIPSITIDAKGRITNATTTSIIAGVNTVASIAGTSNAAGATISGTTITLTPADGTNGGVLTNGTQTIAGAKTFSGAGTFSSTLSAGATTLASASVTGNETVGGTLGVTGAASLGNTLTVTGAGTFSSTLSAGATTLASASVTGNETVGGTLGVTGATSLGNTLTVTGAGTFSSTLSAGATTLASASVTGNETVGGTLGVAGATTLAAVTATGTATLSGTVIHNSTTTLNGNTSITGSNTLTVGTGATSLGGTLAVTGAGTFSSTLSAGATTLTSASITVNETVGGTLGVTGATTLTAVTTTGTATLSGTVNIPANAGAGKVLISDATGNATWNSNPYASIALITTATATTAYAADLSKKYIIYNYGTAEAGKISVPAAATANAGAEIIIKNKSANTVTITPLSSGTIYIDNANTSAASVALGIEASNNWIRLVSDGSQWIVFRALF